MQATLRPGRVKPVTADLAPATGVRTTRFCRTLETSFVVARLLEPLTGPLRTRPATPWRADALASTTSRPAFVTIAIRPSCRNGTGDLKPLIWGRCEAQSCPSCHCAAVPFSSFRGAKRSGASPESITTNACCHRRCGPSFAQHQRSWLWIPGSRQAGAPRNDEKRGLRYRAPRNDGVGLFRPQGNARTDSPASRAFFR